MVLDAVECHRAAASRRSDDRRRAAASRGSDDNAVEHSSNHNTNVIHAPIVFPSLDLAENSIGDQGAQQLRLHSCYGQRNPRV